jgi:hypothetical protein
MSVKRGGVLLNSLEINERKVRRLAVAASIAVARARIIVNREDATILSSEQ